MKEFFKSILKVMGIYFPLQQFYRQSLLKAEHKKIRKEFEIYKGTGFSCNVCGAQYKRFANRYPEKNNKKAILENKVIGGYGENVFCPECMSTARERLVIAMLSNLNIDHKKILHLSPEQNVFRYISGKADVITADLHPGFYKCIDMKVRRADVTQLPFPDNYFDIVIGNHILEHIPEDQKAMKEIYRVLIPTGKAILQVPYSTTISNTIEEPAINDPGKQSALFGQKDHVRIYELNDYMNRLQKAGFHVKYYAPENLQEFNSFAIQPEEGFFLCNK